MNSPLDAIAWPVRTDRLALRPARPDDVEATWRFRRLDHVGRWLTRAPATIEEHRSRFEDPQSLDMTLVLELEGVVIGDLMLKVEDAWAQAEVEEQAHGVQAELGWVLHPDHAGVGYATEAVRAIISVCVA
jgi:RimJ/RimL family protein N-acetyltransferase